MPPSSILLPISPSWSWASFPRAGPQRVEGRTFSEREPSAQCVRSREGWPEWGSSPRPARASHLHPGHRTACGPTSVCAPQSPPAWLPAVHRPSLALTGGWGLSPASPLLSCHFIQCPEETEWNTDNKMSFNKYQSVCSGGRWHAAGPARQGQVGTCLGLAWLQPGLAPRAVSGVGTTLAAAADLLPP